MRSTGHIQGLFWESWRVERKTGKLALSRDQTGEISSMGPVSPQDNHAASDGNTSEPIKS